ncbi:hypothetical protein PR001_g27031 [Phytophthora rubi]|uniref:Uncharacterized protein n=1 Tax=Phytophthora rubi TaxID=129364 RepID=A0A6A3HNQ7_9STRA|nr:hypothetical protein PR001_g27031 [Phytophthora rubi]KAE9034470.1 hypothetical protein PR002_g8119 [Phytophthora rubi]
MLLTWVNCTENCYTKRRQHWLGTSSPRVRVVDQDDLLPNWLLVRFKDIIEDSLNTQFTMAWVERGVRLAATLPPPGRVCPHQQEVRVPPSHSSHIDREVVVLTHDAEGHESGIFRHLHGHQHTYLHRQTSAPRLATSPVSELFLLELYQCS